MVSSPLVDYTFRQKLLRLILPFMWRPVAFSSVSILFQAKTSQDNSPLHAEAFSLFLGLHLIIDSLQVHECDFLADSSELITCMKEHCDITLDWRKGTIMDMNIRGNLYHIPTEKNSITDQLARNAILL